MVYEILIPSMPFIIGYLLTYVFYRCGLIKKSLHVNVWNFILLMSFIISGGAGFILIILLEIEVALPISPHLLYWHVELGITLTLVTIFHFHNYWKTARKMFTISHRGLKHEKKDN